MSFKTNPKGYRLGINKYWDNSTLQKTNIWTLEKKITTYYESILINSISFLEAIIGNKLFLEKKKKELFPLLLFPKNLSDNGG